MAGAICYRLLTEIPDALFMIELSVPMVSRVIGTGISYSVSYSNHELAEYLRIPDPSVKKTAQVRQNLVKLCELFEVNTKFAVLLEFMHIFTHGDHSITFKPIS